MTARHDTVFLLDVDNTLLDNDRVVADLHAHLKHEFGVLPAGRYWAHFEALRSELGYADYLGALQRWRLDAEPLPGDEMPLLKMSEFLIDYPFVDRLYPQALDVVRRLNASGLTVILTDGDVVFQPRKIQRSGLWDAVAGRVLIYIHKEQMLEAVQRHFPARHYVMVDDKVRILAAMKGVMQGGLTTVFPRQGHYALEYALDAAALAAYPPADIAIERIGELLDIDLRDLRDLRDNRVPQETP